jgi:hypothetical protein
MNRARLQGGLDDHQGVGPCDERVVLRQKGSSMTCSSERPQHRARASGNRVEKLGA